jgi:hypothetical protein
LAPFAKSLSLSAGTRSGRRSDPVNEAFAAKYFGGQNPIGRTFTIERYGSHAPRQVEIVGLIANAKYRALREDPAPTMYVDGAA